jgi:hypothetical protein
MKKTMAHVIWFYLIQRTLVFNDRLQNTLFNQWIQKWDIIMSDVAAFYQIRFPKCSVLTIFVHVALWKTDNTLKFFIYQENLDLDSYRF